MLIEGPPGPEGRAVSEITTIPLFYLFILWNVFVANILDCVLEHLSIAGLTVLHKIPQTLYLPRIQKTDLSESIVGILSFFLGPYWPPWPFWTSRLCGWPRWEGEYFFFLFHGYIYCLNNITVLESTSIQPSLPSHLSAGPSRKTRSAWCWWSPWTSWKLSHATCESLLTLDSLLEIDILLALIDVCV